MTIKVEPSPGLLCAVMNPPWRSVMRRQTASPTPVPSYSLRPCRRLKHGKNLVQDFLLVKADAVVLHGEHAKRVFRAGFGRLVGQHGIVAELVAR